MPTTLTPEAAVHIWLSIAVVMAPWDQRPLPNEPLFVAWAIGSAAAAMAAAAIQRAHRSPNIMAAAAARRATPAPKSIRRVRRWPLQTTSSGKSPHWALIKDVVLRAAALAAHRVEHAQTPLARTISKHVCAAPGYYLKHRIGRRSACSARERADDLQHALCHTSNENKNGTMGAATTRGALRSPVRQVRPPSAGHYPYMKRQVAQECQVSALNHLLGQAFTNLAAVLVFCHKLVADVAEAEKPMWRSCFQDPVGNFGDDIFSLWMRSYDLAYSRVPIPPNAMHLTSQVADHLLQDHPTPLEGFVIYDNTPNAHGHAKCIKKHRGTWWLLDSNYDLPRPLAISTGAGACRDGRVLLKQGTDFHTIHRIVNHSNGMPATGPPCPCAMPTPTRGGGLPQHLLSSD